MKTAKLCTACACLVLVAGTLPAQNYYLATQQAKRASTQNDAEQQRIQGASGNAGAAPAPMNNAPAANGPVDPTLQATLKNIAGLQSDFAQFVAAGTAADSSQKVSLLNNLAQAAQGAKVSDNSIKKLVDDLVPAVTGKKKLGVAQQANLARDIHALFNSAHLTDAQQQKLVAEVQNTLTDGGASLDDAVDVATDLKAIVAETK